MPTKFLTLFCTLYCALCAYADPPPISQTDSLPSGALVIAGGGELPMSVRDRFLELAGGKNAHLVVIPTASAEFQKSGVSFSFLYWKTQAVASVELLHARDREQANDPEFLKPLMNATAVWLGGGNQSRLTQKYAGTATEKELHNVLRRGGVIGGNSAGAAAMSSIMITGGNPVARIGSGFGLLSNVVIDQHFQNRKRQPRLLGVLKKHPNYAGIGIDEDTALVVRGNLGTVLGKAKVWICLSPLEQLPESVQGLTDGQTINLTSLAETVLARTERSSAPATVVVPSTKTLSAP